MSEHQEQTSLFTWARSNSEMIRPLRMLFAIPNGGKRSDRERIYMTNEGLEKGIPDLMLAVSRGGHHGLFVEMKVKPHGRVSKDQKRWIAELKKEGYRVEVAWSCKEAQAVILDYLGVKYV